MEDFDLNEPQSDDDRMDALAITPVCLRVALCIDNRSVINSSIFYKNLALSLTKNLLK